MTESSCPTGRHEFHPGDKVEDDEGNLVRTAAGYKYYSAKLEELHTTSLPLNDEEACEYFSIVGLWFDAENQPRYVARRAFEDGGYKMIPWEYNYLTEQYQPIQRPS